jgi:hypothetical protein
MYIPIILAHGALGLWDELIFLGVAAIFLTMMGISWLRNRNAAPPLDTPPPSRDVDAPRDTIPDSDRFRLE